MNDIFIHLFAYSFFKGNSFLNHDFKNEKEAINTSFVTTLSQTTLKFENEIKIKTYMMIQM